MCEELSYQIINISAVNQSVFGYHWKFAKIIEKKAVLAVVTNEVEEMHFFELI